MDEKIGAKNNLHNNYVQIKSKPNASEMRMLKGIDNQASNLVGDYTCDIEPRETSHSFQNVDVPIKEEPGTYDTRGHYSYYETEGIDQSSGHQSCNSGVEDLHVAKEPNSESYGRDYAVCIKYEPMSHEVSEPYMKSGRGVNSGIQNDQTKYINGTPDKSCGYENCSHTQSCSGDILKRTCIDKHKQYKCDICGFCSEHASGLLVHIRRKHKGEKPYKCNQCSFSTVWSKYLAVHKRIHTGEKPYKCNMCSYSCISASHLVVHKRTHTGKKQYKCDMCSYSSFWSHALARHKVKHTGEKYYKCDICNYSAASSVSLSKHKRKHTRDILYKCDICSLSFFRSGDLARHKRFKHLLVNNAISSDDLAKTKVKHAGENPYKCDVCSYSSMLSSQLILHKRKHKLGENPK